MKKTIIVTGSSRGIGLSITKQLLQEGHEVVGIARHHTIDHENYIPKTIDLRNLKILPQQFKALAKIPANSLICNAGIWHYCHFEELSFEKMEEILHVNFLSHVFLVKAFLPRMKKERKGEILFLGSTSGLKGAVKESLYSASKAALRAFSQSLRSECATQNIRVMMINPGAVKTEMIQLAPLDLGSDPLNHILPDDIARLISFLLSERMGTVFDEITLSPQKYRLEKRQNLSQSECHRLLGDHPPV